MQLDAEDQPATLPDRAACYDGLAVRIHDVREYIGIIGLLHDRGDWLWNSRDTPLYNINNIGRMKFPSTLSISLGRWIGADTTITYDQFINRFGSIKSTSFIEVT